MLRSRGKPDRVEVQRVTANANGAREGELERITSLQRRTGRDGPDFAESVPGRKSGSDEAKPERKRLPPRSDRPAMGGPGAGGTRGSNPTRSRKGPAQDSGSDVASPVTTGHGDAASSSRKRRRCRGGGPGSDSRQASGDARSSEHKRRDVACYGSSPNRRTPNLACCARSDAPEIGRAHV